MTNIVKKTTAVAKRSTALDKIRAATAKPLATPAGRAVGAPAERRPRLVFGVDATASREPTWTSAKQITDRMFDAIPGALDVALAVHGGSQLHTFTEFSADPQAFRAQAARVRCEAGQTQICELLHRAIEAGGVRVVSYIGDAFEEMPEEAFALADRCKLRGIKVVILADQAGEHALQVFREIAERTGGAVLDFRSGELDLMGEVLEGVAALALGGRKLLASSAKPGAKLLLQHLAK